MANVSAARTVPPACVWMDGMIYPEDEAKISVFDRGFLYGDSVYEVTRTFGGKPFALEEHLVRLAHSANAIGIPLPGRGLLEEAVKQAVAAGNFRDAYIRIIVTRGAGDIGLDPALADKPRLLVIARQVEGPQPEMYEQGVEVRIVSVTRNARRAIDPAVKSGNYLNNVLAIAEAKRESAYEALMLDTDGRIAECSTSNIFFVRGERVFTPALEIGILDGITRQKVFEICAEQKILVEEGAYLPDELKGADEAFLTSSVRGVLPVVRVDGKDVGKGKPGAITRRIMKGYEALTQAAAKGEKG